MEEKREEILSSIAAKGGLYALAAIKFRTDPVKAEQFIVECFEQCRHLNTLRHWGSPLVLDIIAYRIDLLKRALKEVDGLRLSVIEKYGS